MKKVPLIQIVKEERISIEIIEKIQLEMTKEIV